MYSQSTCAFVQVTDELDLFPNVIVVPVHVTIKTFPFAVFQPHKPTRVYPLGMSAEAGAND